MTEHGLTRAELLRTLPPPLQNDTVHAALADMTAQQLAAQPVDLDRLRIYANIDALPEGLLDILAYDFKIDWWDPDYSVGEKRRMLRSSWFVHRRLGTKAAVETALSAIYPGARVEEWFDYGGEPYHFRLWIDTGSSGFDQTRHRKVLQSVAWYKNLRSWMDAVTYSLPIILLPERPGTGTLRRLRIPLRFLSYGLEAVRLNGSRRLDGSWTLAQSFLGLPFPTLQFRLTLRGSVERVRAATALHMSAPGLEERIDLWQIAAFRLRTGPQLGGCGPQFPALRLALTLRGAEERVCAAMALCVSAPGSEERIGLRQVALFRLRTGTLTRLDGSRRLDGSWTLMQDIRGVDLPRIAFALVLPELQRVRAGPLHGGRASVQTWERAALQRAGTGCTAREQGNAVLQSMAWAASFQNLQGCGAGSLTRDSRWRLDGQVRLDGQKRLNAAITKEEL